MVAVVAGPLTAGPRHRLPAELAVAMFHGVVTERVRARPQPEGPEGVAHRRALGVDGFALLDDRLAHRLGRVRAHRDRARPLAARPSRTAVVPDRAIVIAHPVPQGTETTRQRFVLVLLVLSDERDVLHHLLVDVVGGGQLVALGGREPVVGLLRGAFGEDLRLVDFRDEEHELLVSLDARATELGLEPGPLLDLGRFGHGRVAVLDLGRGHVVGFLGLDLFVVRHLCDPIADGLVPRDRRDELQLARADVPQVLGRLATDVAAGVRGEPALGRQVVEPRDVVHASSLGRVPRRAVVGELVADCYLHLSGGD